MQKYQNLFFLETVKFGMNNACILHTLFLWPWPFKEKRKERGKTTRNGSLSLCECALQSFSISHEIFSSLKNLPNEKEVSVALWIIQFIYWFNLYLVVVKMMTLQRQLGLRCVKVSMLFFLLIFLYKIGDCTTSKYFYILSILIKKITWYNK